MTKPKTMANWQKEFDKQFLESYHEHDKCSDECSKKYGEKNIRNDVFNFITDLLAEQRKEIVKIAEGIKRKKYYCTSEYAGYHDKNCENCEWNGAVDKVIEAIKKHG